MSERVVADMQAYYAGRAAEYERVYAKPERQADLRAIEAWLPGCFAGRRAIEIACGTGWWTQFAARDATQWLATDVNPETLAIARGKALPASVRLSVADAYALAGVEGRFDAAFAGFWWSHVPLERTGEWLDGLHACLLPSARVVLIDNRFVERSSSPITRRDEAGNSYQTRRLDDGATFEVLKNFPGEDDMRRLLGDHAREFSWTQWPHFWACTYTTA